MPETTNKAESRQSYVKPQLTTHGDVAKLTQGPPVCMPPDGSGLPG